MKKKFKSKLIPGMNGVATWDDSKYLKEEFRPFDGIVMASQPQEVGEWEERFDKKFVKYHTNAEATFSDPNGSVGPIKQFIRSLLKRQEEDIMGRFAKQLTKEVLEKMGDKIK